MIALCVLVKTIHFIYIVVSYLLVPFVFGPNRRVQVLSLVNTALLVLHWKLLDDRCILDIVESRICPPSVYKRFNNRLVSVEELTFSNFVQVFVISSVFIAASTLLGRPLSRAQRWILLALNVAVVAYVVRLTSVMRHYASPPGCTPPEPYTHRFHQTEACR